MENIADTNEYIEHLFHFTLSDIEIDTLKKNIGFASKVIEIEFINGQQQLEGSWLWATPSINNQIIAP